MEQITTLNKISKISIYVLVFLIPLWFLPVTQDVLNFQKQTLFIVLVLVSFIAWMAQTIQQQELNIRTSQLNVLVGITILIGAISSLLSLWRYGSFWGWPLNSSDSFVTILFFGILYFLVSNVFEEPKEIFDLFFFFVISSTISGLYTILQLYNIFIIPFSVTRAVTFNTIGSVFSVAILQAVLLPLVLAMAFSVKSRMKWFYWISSLLLFLVILLINFSSAWLVLATGLIVFLVFSMRDLKNNMKSGLIYFPMALLIVSLLFLILQISFPGAPNSSIEASPSKSAEMSVLFNTLKGHPLFGTGPGTFVFDYTKYHPTNLNQTIFWGTRFISGSSEILDWFITKGILGGLLLLAIIAIAVLFMARMLVRSEENGFSWIFGLGLLSSFSGMIVANIIYYSNFTLSFLFWILLASLVFFVAKPKIKVSIAPPSFLAIISSFVFLLVLILGVGFLFVGGQKYIAEAEYSNGSQMVAKGDTDKGIAKMISAVRLNPSLDIYWRDLAQLYLLKANQTLVDKNLSDDQKKQQSQNAIFSATASANQATTLSPNNVENWNVRGFVYRNLIGINDADSMAISSYEKSISLEPSSPFSFTELGRVYLLKAQNLNSQKDTQGQQEEALNKSLENLNKAISLKPDYAPANYLVALVYGQQGKSDEEIDKLEKTKLIAPDDIGLAFQLGLLYYQKNNFGKAQAEFERAKLLNPGYSNARYMLGLVYDKIGSKEKAVQEFIKVLELNPDNIQIKQIIANLNSGKPALSGIVQSQPPIQENPSEIKGGKK